MRRRFGRGVGELTVLTCIFTRVCVEAGSIGAVGAAVDFSRINASRTSFQNAVDSTALMLAKEARDLSAVDLNAKTNAYFKAVYSDSQAYNVKVTPQLTSPQQGTFNLSISGNATIDMTFAKILGYPNASFSANST